MAVSTRRSGPTGTPVQREPPMPPEPPARQPREPNVPPPDPVFALSPALATRGIIDHNSRAGERIYTSATKELGDTKYNGEAQGLMAFLELLEERANNFGWDRTIMLIPNEEGTSKNLLTEY